MTCRPLTDTEVALITAKLPNMRDRALFVLGVKTGFRISELLSLTIHDVAGDQITVSRKNMKGKNRSRTVPLHNYARSVLREYLVQMSGASDEKLFPITRQHAWRILKGAARDAGLKGTISTHSMRKTFGTRIYQVTGKDIVAAQHALGHKSLASTSHYLSVNKDIVDKAILSD